MNWRRAWGLGCVALSLGAACTETPATPGPDAGPASDVASDAPATDAPSGSCSLEPRLDLDRDGVTTPQGTAGWEEFSRASEAQQLTPIPTCGGAVYNAALVQWTAPRAGILRMRVERDRSDWSQEMIASAYLSARRVERCAWDAPARECSVATFETDPEHTRSEFEFRVEAGTQYIALAWSFNYAGAGVRTTAVPALRVAVRMVEQSAYGQACAPSTTDREQLCPARSDCTAVGPAAPTCVARGAQGGLCRGPLRDCDTGLVCGAIGFSCDAPAAIGESCQNRGCAAGSSCHVRTPVSESRCVALGSLHGGCREGNACDASLTCRTVDGRAICVQETAAGAPCDATSYCASGGVCAPDATGRSVCTAPGSEGTRCGSSAGQPLPCMAGLRCVDQFCRRTRAAAEACDDDRVCNAGLACVDGRCAEPPTGRCTTRGDRCPEGQRCVNRACAPAVALGGMCTGQDCAAGLVCPSDTRRCEVAAPSLGCVDDQDCPRGTACREHVCLVVGQCPQRDVFSNVICDEGSRCVPTAAGPYACHPIGRDGGPCRSGAPGPCDAGHRCVGGVCLAATSAASGVCGDRLRCPPGTRCEAGCQAEGAAGAMGARCRRGAGGAAECDAGLRCDLATLTCVP